MPHWQLSFAQCAEGRQSPLPQPHHLKVSLNHSGNSQRNHSGNSQLNQRNHSGNSQLNQRSHSGNNRRNSSGNNQHLLATFLRHWHLEVNDWEDSF
jgi:hypothetical protein